MFLCALILPLMAAAGVGWPAAPAWGQDSVADGRARVLYMSAYHPAFPTFPQQVDGLRAGLRDAGLRPGTTTLDIEFMDSKRFSSQRLRDLHRESLALKLDGLPPYDVVVVGDDNALWFAISEKNDLFAGVPIVFLGVNDVELAVSQNNDPQVTGVVEAPSMADNLRLVEDLVTAPGRLFVVADDTSTSRVNVGHFYAAGPVLERLTPVLLSLEELTYDELNAALGEAGENDAVLLIAAYRDHTGATKPVLEAVRFLDDATRAPIFSPWAHGIGHGVVGGKVISHHAQGRAAGRIAGAIVAGASPADFPVTAESPNRYIFDYDALRQHGISLDRLPADAVIRNRQTPVWEQYPTEITVAVGVSLVMASLILVLSYAVRLQRRSNRRLDAAQKELTVSNDHLASILDTAPDAIVLVDKELRIIRFNKAAEAMFGWRESEMLGRPLGELIPPEQREAHEAMARRFLDESDSRTLFMSNWQRARARRKDGDDFPISVALSKVRSDDGPIATAIVRDMSDVARTTRELARLSQRLENQLRVAEDANLAKSRFLANMSHELRTPLNAIIGFSEVLEQETMGPLGSPKYKEYVGDVIHSGLHLKSLVDDLLDFARIDEGRIELRPVAVTPRDLVSDALKAVRTLAWKQRLRLRGSAARDLPDVSADRRAVHQCLLNLLSNAIKFSAPGGAVMLRAERDGDAVVFSVEDEGPGIEPEMIEKLGQPFEQAGDLYRAGNQGAGLGLAITRSLAEMMGGEMTIASELGRGTRISIRLPLAETQRMTA